jgi:tripartite-type tricarboxylate transporter receptor subunit TctC
MLRRQGACLGSTIAQTRLGAFRRASIRSALEALKRSLGFDNKETRMSARMKHRLLLGAVVLGAIGTGAAAQEGYPDRPIRLITPFAPGGSTTFTARLIGQQLTEAWGQQVVVDNRPGANTIIGTRLAVNSRPDGYTLLVLSSALAGNHTLAKTPYDALKDIATIATVMSYESILVVPPSSPVKRIKDLIALAKAKPGEVTFGTSSTGGATHILAELFNAEAGIRTLRVPYKGGAPAVVDLMGGHINFFISNPVNVASQIKSGRLRALAVTGKSRLSAFPDVPTFAEEGLPGVMLTNWQGVGGPAGISQPIINRISAEVRKLVAKPETKATLNKLGFEPFYNNPEKTAALLKADIDTYARIVKLANIESER